MTQPTCPQPAEPTLDHQPHDLNARRRPLMPMAYADEMGEVFPPVTTSGLTKRVYLDEPLVGLFLESLDTLDEDEDPTVPHSFGPDQMLAHLLLAGVVRLDLVKSVILLGDERVLHADVEPLFFSFANGGENAGDDLYGDVGEGDEP